MSENAPDTFKYSSGFEAQNNHTLFRQFTSFASRHAVFMRFKISNKLINCIQNWQRGMPIGGTGDYMQDYQF